MYQIGNKARILPNDQIGQLDIVGSTKFGRYDKISSEATWNMIVSDGALVNFYGYKSIFPDGIQGNGTARELFSSQGYNHLIAVIDRNVYTISVAFELTLVGSLATSAGPVFITENQPTFNSTTQTTTGGNQIAIVDGKFVYIFNYSNNNFQQITVDFAPVYITYQDGYFIAADGNTNQWRISQPSDGTQWPQVNSDGSTNVGLYQTKPGKTIATVAFNRQLMVMGQTGMESWTDVGNILFPYARNNSYSADYGCISTETIGITNNIMMWLGSNESSGLQLLYSLGDIPQPIHFDGLEFLFSQLKAPQDCYGFLFKLDGHIYYQFTFVTDNLSFVYDWDNKAFYSLSDTDGNFHIAKRIAFFNNNYYFISFNDPNLYQMGSQFTDYNGKIIPRKRITTNKRLPSLDRYVMDNIVITMESGIYSQPLRVELSISKDGGYSYGNVVEKYLPSYAKSILNPSLKFISQENNFQILQEGSGNVILVEGSHQPEVNQPVQPPTYNNPRQNTLQFWNLGGQGNDNVFQFAFESHGGVVITGAEFSFHA